MIVPLAAALAAPAPLRLIIPASLLGGVQVSIYNVFQSTTLQNELPNDMISRARRARCVGALVAVPIGTGFAGPIAAALGTRAVLGGVAVIAVVVTLATLTVPDTWRVGSAPVQPEPSVAEPSTAVSSPAEPQEVIDPEAERRTVVGGAGAVREE